MEPGVDIQFQGQNVLFRVLLEADEAQKAGVRAESWYESVVKTEVAQLATRPAFKNVTELVARREAALFQKEGHARAVADIRASLRSSEAVTSNTTLDQAVKEIGEHEAAIRRLDLAIESINAMLPDAIQAREHDSKHAVRELHHRLLSAIEKEKATKAKEVVKNIGSGGVEWLELEERLARLERVRVQAVDRRESAVTFVESMVEEAAAGKAGASAS